MLHRIAKAGVSALTLFLLVGVARAQSTPSISGATIQAFQTSLTLSPGNSVYIYGMNTGGGFPTTGFAQGAYQSVTDVDGNVAAALAFTNSNSDSFTTSDEYYVIGGVGVSGFTSMTESYGSNTQSGASQASDTFTLTQSSLVVIFGMASSQQSIALSGISGLQIDALSSGQPNTPVAMVIAHANLPPGTYTASEQSAALAPAQDPNHMTGLIGVFVFSGAPIPGIGPSGGTVNPQAMVAEPVSTGNGNYYYQHSDFALVGRRLPLVFQRSYNSLDNYSGPLGANWTHSYNVILTASATNAVIKWGDGHGETYTLSGGTYVPQPGVFNTLVQNMDGTLTLTTKAQTRYNFSAAGALVSIVDRNGNQTLLSYNGSGNLIQITDAVGRALTLTYDSNNRVIKVVDPVGRAVSYAYDQNNNLVQAIDAAGGITAFAYDSAHHVTSVTLPNGNVLLANTYDASGRVISQTNGRGFTWNFAYDSPSAGQTTITDALGNKTVHSYDSSLRITQIADALGGIVSYSYDANNDRTTVTNQSGQTTVIAYDGRGNVTSIRDPLGDVSTFAYDASNDLLTSTDPRNETTAFSYDSNGNLILVTDPLGDATSFKYDSFGEVTRTTDANSNATAFTYDGFGNIASFTDPLTDSTNLTHDEIGRLTSVTDPTGQTWSASYDALDRLTLRTDPLTDKTRYSYDPVGNLLAVVDANGHTTSYSYDATNDLTTVADALGHVTRYSYDGDDNRISFTNANGNVTSYGYDALNRLIKTTDPLGLVTSYTYDPVGNLTSQTDAKGQTNTFSHDALNRLVGISYADGNNVAYSYDADGNRTAMVDSHGTTNYTYDPLDRLVSVAFPGGANVGYAYDAVGERQSLTYPDGRVVNYSYDPARRLAAVTDWLGRKTAYSYDADTNLLRASYPNGAGLSFAYDTANRLTHVSNSYEPGRGTTFKQISKLSYLLDPVGNRLQVTDGAGNTTSYSYDALNELVSVETGDRTSFAYDPDGNRLTQQTQNTLSTYVYDADDRLLSVTTNFPHNDDDDAHDHHASQGDLQRALQTTFTYDADGNRVSEGVGEGTLSYAYDAANRLVAVTSAGGEPGGEAKSWMRPQSFGDNFAYDGDGNRISQGPYGYVNDIATPLPVVLKESGPDGSIDYTYGLGRISETGNWSDYFYQYDGLGSVVGLTDPRGHLATLYSYDAWGNSAPFPPDWVGTANKFRFTGEALDQGTGLYYLRARYYDPSVGRFLSRDPFAGFANRPFSRNRYVYVANNPTDLSDPTGQITPIEDAIAAGLGALIGVGSDLITQVVIEHTSLNAVNWNQVAGAAAGGAVGGFLFVNPELGGPFAAGAASGATANLVTQGLNNLERKQTGVNVTSLVTQTAIGAASGAIPGGEVTDIIGGTSSSGSAFVLWNVGTSVDVSASTDLATALLGKPAGQGTAQAGLSPFPSHTISVSSIPFSTAGAQGK